MFGLMCHCEIVGYMIFPLRWWTQFGWSVSFVKAAGCLHHGPCIQCQAAVIAKGLHGPVCWQPRHACYLCLSRLLFLGLSLEDLCCVMSAPGTGTNAKTSANAGLGLPGSSAPKQEESKPSAGHINNGPVRWGNSKHNSCRMLLIITLETMEIWTSTLWKFLVAFFFCRRQNASELA